MPYLRKAGDRPKFLHSISSPQFHHLNSYSEICTVYFVNVWNLIKVKPCLMFSYSAPVLLNIWTMVLVDHSALILVKLIFPLQNICKL